MIAFVDDGHKYVSVSPELQGVNWISGTKFASMFHDKFDPALGAAKSSQNKRSKWFGMSPDLIQEIWKRESKRSTDTGTLHHLAMEKKYLSMETMDLFGRKLKVYHPTHDDAGRKLSPDQSFPEGVHPEALLYHRLTDNLGICGQSDTVATYEDLANISDHKSNKKMKMQGYYDKWSGKTQMMHWPFQFLDDCDFSKYTIQMNLYLYILLKNNPNLRPGKLVLRHVKFKVESEDEFGFPTHVFEDGLPVVDQVVKYDVPVIPMSTMDKAINHLIENYN
jgi:hypothetical protein